MPCQGPWAVLFSRGFCTYSGASREGIRVCNLFIFFPQFRLTIGWAICGGNMSTNHTKDSEGVDGDVLGPVLDQQGRARGGCPEASGSGIGNQRRRCMGGERRGPPGRTLGREGGEELAAGACRGRSLPVSPYS